MRAIQTISVGKASIVDIPEPELKPDSILVRPHYIGNNPCDWLTVDFEMVFTAGQTVGVDYSGVVEKIGSDVNTDLKPGDKVCGAVAAGVGCDVTRGCFAELVPAYGNFCFPVPQNVSMEQAATFGVLISTMAMSFYQDLGLPLPEDDLDFGRGKYFFIFGGSSATGLLAIQFAKLSGFHVITTCSPRNFDLVKSRGADETYDYSDIDRCTKDIKASVGDDLQYAYVCVMNDDAPKLCAEVLSSKGGKMVSLVPCQCPRDDVQSIMTFGQTCMADVYKAGPQIMKSTPEQHALGVRVWKMSLRLFDEGKLQPSPIELRQGLEGALQGMEDLRKNAVSGKKIVSQLV